MAKATPSWGFKTWFDPEEGQLIKLRKELARKEKRGEWADKGSSTESIKERKEMIDLLDISEIEIFNCLIPG